MPDAWLQIGQVAQRPGLSVTTIRRYEDLGLLAATRRSKGGFRLYSEADVQRPSLLQDMRPLDFSVEEKLGLLLAFDGLAEPAATGTQRAEHADRLAMYRDVVDQRIDAVREQLTAARHFARTLTWRLEASDHNSSTDPQRSNEPR